MITLIRAYYLAIIQVVVDCSWLDNVSAYDEYVDISSSSCLPNVLGQNGTYILHKLCVSKHDEVIECVVSTNISKLKKWDLITFGLLSWDSPSIIINQCSIQYYTYYYI